MIRGNRLLLGTDTSMDRAYDNRTFVPYDADAKFDSNMVIIMAALLCALICALGINSSQLTFSPPDTLNKDTITQIPVASGVDIRGSDCPICLGEFVQGEDVGIFPKCNHCFHVKCIGRWLVSHSSCPTCRQPWVQHSAAQEHVTLIEIR